MTLTVKDVMWKAPGFISERASITTAAKLLSEYGQGALPICSEDDRVVGMITDRDITVKVVAAELDPTTTSVLEVSREPVVAMEDQSLVEIVAMMREEHVRRLPVVTRHGELAGLISFAEVAKRLSLEELGDLSFVGDFFHPTAM
jgi:CBS domain-containing protein